MYCDWPLLGRCCFCMPLRRGILTFAYLNLFFSAFMVGVYSYSVHTSMELVTVYHGAHTDTSGWTGIVIYCIELIFTAFLIYGAHMKITPYIKAYYYFSLTTIVASVLVLFIDVVQYPRPFIFFEVAPIMFASLCIQIYLLLLIRSLLRKMDISSGPNVYDNPLGQFVYEGKVETNGVYDSTVVPVEV